MKKGNKVYMSEWQTVTYKKVKRIPKERKIQEETKTEEKIIREDNEMLPEPSHYKCKKYEYA